MSPRNECVDAALEELERFGLKGEVSQRGKHIEVAWKYPDGRSHFQIVAASTSDRRAVLNVRGDVRRQLRADNIQPPPPKVLSFERAISLPKPTDFAAERLRRLEADVEGLVDLVADLQAELVEQRRRLSSARVTTTLQFDVPEALPAVAQKPQGMRQPGKRSGVVLELLKIGNWISRADLITATGFNEKDVSSVLYYLKTKGLVENGQRGMWRKKPEVAQQSA